MMWDGVRGWVWHLFNDPIRDNVWSLAGLILIVAGGMGMLYLLGEKVRIMMFRRRNKGDGDMPDDKAQADQAIRQARALHDDDADGRTDQPGERLQVIPPMEQGEDGKWKVVGATDGSGGPPRYYDAEPLPPANPITDSGVHALPSAVGEHRIACEHCQGSGYVTRSTNDLLRESLDLVGDGGDMIVKEFYTRLLHAAPDLAPLFPADLITAQTSDPGSGGARQRDRLLGALVALANSYAPEDPAGMKRLDTALAAFGRSHAAFARPDGTTRGATLDEYAAVKSVLFETLVQAAGDAWIPEYTVAWSEAYDYAAATMLYEQHRAGFRFPRAPRA